MIRSTLLTMSEGVSLDQLTGGLASIYNVMEQINVTKLPIVIPKLCVVAFFEKGTGDDEKFELEYKLSIGDVKIDSNKVPLDFKGRLKHKWIHVFNGIELKTDGQLKLSLLIYGKEVNRGSIDVKMA